MSDGIFAQLGLKINWDRWRPYLFLAPSFILIFGFVYIPLLIALVISLYDNPGLVIISEDFVGYYSDPTNLYFIGLGTFVDSLKENGFLPVFHAIALAVGIPIWYNIGKLGFPKIGQRLKPRLNKRFHFRLTNSKIFLLSFATNLLFTTLAMTLSLSIISATGPDVRVPLRNYQEIFTRPTIIGDFLRILLNTFLWAAIGTFFHVVLGMSLAIMLNGNFKGRKFFRTAFILPWAIPSLISALVWRNFVLDRNRGILGRPVADRVEPGSTMVFTFFDLGILIICLFVCAADKKGMRKMLNYLIIIVSTVIVFYIFTLNTTSYGPLGGHFIKIDKITTKFFFSSNFYILGFKTKTIFLAAIITNIWLGVPFMMLSFLATLQSIPPDLYEAAEIDGAGTWAKFRNVTFPNLVPTLRTVVLLGMIWTFNLFNVFFILSQNQTGLGPRQNYDIFITYIYYLFRQGTSGEPDYAAAAALSFVVFIILILFSRMYSFLFRELEEEKQ